MRRFTKPAMTMMMGAATQHQQQQRGDAPSDQQSKSPLSLLASEPRRAFASWELCLVGVNLLATTAVGYTGYTMNAKIDQGFKELGGEVRVVERDVKSALANRCVVQHISSMDSLPSNTYAVSPTSARLVVDKTSEPGINITSNITTNISTTTTNSAMYDNAKERTVLMYCRRIRDVDFNLGNSLFHGVWLDNQHILTAAHAVIGLFNIGDRKSKMHPTILAQETIHNLVGWDSQSKSDAFHTNVEISHVSVDREYLDVCCDLASSQQRRSAFSLARDVAVLTLKQPLTSVNLTAPLVFNTDPPPHEESRFQHTIWAADTPSLSKSWAELTTNDLEMAKFHRFESFLLPNRINGEVSEYFGPGQQGESGTGVWTKKGELLGVHVGSRLGGQRIG